MAGCGSRRAAHHDAVIGSPASSMSANAAEEHDAEQSQPRIHTVPASLSALHPHPPSSLAHPPYTLWLQSISGAEYATLATVTAEGLPTARTVWIRELYQARALLITTDSRTPKTTQLSPPNLASLCYYLPLAKEQYQLLCRPTLLTHRTTYAPLAELRQTVWQQSPDWLQQWYNGPEPGQPKATAKPVDDQQADGVSESFVVVLLWPVRCDYLRLPVTVIDNSKPLHRESRLKPQKEQQRWLHSRDANTALWTLTELNP